jgi:DNA-binding transcriptional LysR family regulator
MSINLSLRQMQAFVAVARQLSFRRAADALGMSEPALSQSIRQLEEQARGRLFDRTTRSVRLTPLGEHLLPRAERIVEECRRTFDEVADIALLKRGEVTIGCLSSLVVRFLPGVISSFNREFPDIRIRVKDDNAAGIQRKLLSGEIDFAINSRLEPNDDIEYRPLLEDPFRLVCLKEHPLAALEEVRWADIVPYSYIGYDKNTSNRRVIDRALIAAGVRLDAQMELSQLGTLVGMVETGFGVAALPSMACPIGSHVASRRLIEEEIFRGVGILRIAGRSLTPAADKLVRRIEQERDIFREFPQVRLM